jgi:hypothetical protein
MSKRQARVRCGGSSGKIFLVKVVFNLENLPSTTFFHHKPPPLRFELYLLLKNGKGTFPFLLAFALCYTTDLAQSALFNFPSALLCLLLLICTSAYIHQLFPGIMDRNKDGLVNVQICGHMEAKLRFRAFTGVFWKCARIGERLSPYISACCIVMAVSLRIRNEVRAR